MTIAQKQETWTPERHAELARERHIKLWGYPPGGTLRQPIVVPKKKADPEKLYVHAIGPSLPRDGAGPHPKLKPNIEPSRVKSRRKRLSVRDIVLGVAGKHGVPIWAIYSVRRLGEYTAARQEAMAAVVVAYPEYTLVSVAKHFNRDHATVLHALRKLGVWQRTYAPPSPKASAAMCEGA